MTEIVAADIGGTHARFAIAEVADGRVVRLGEAVTLKTEQFDGLWHAWREFARREHRHLPTAASFAIAGPVNVETIRLTNAAWTIRPATIAGELGLSECLLINDFGAVGHAVQHAATGQFTHLCGPDEPLAAAGVISICGPGTGLGVAQLHRDAPRYRVIETEGGHIGFSPADEHEDAVVAMLRERHGRASAERVCAGNAILAHYEIIAKARGWTLFKASPRTIWELGLDGCDEEAVAAVDWLCAALGSVAGDLALAQGAAAVVIAGGLGLRLKDRLPSSPFAARFADKGRFSEQMKRLPVKLITHPQPGLFGAAAAFASRFT